MEELKPGGEKRVAEIRLIRARAERAEMQLAALTASLVAVADVEAGHAAKVELVKERTQPLRNIAPALVGLNAPEISEAIDAEVLRVLTRLSQP